MGLGQIFSPYSSLSLQKSSLGCGLGLQEIDTCTLLESMSRLVFGPRTYPFASRLVWVMVGSKLCSGLGSGPGYL